MTSTCNKMWSNEQSITKKFNKTYLKGLIFWQVWKRLGTLIWKKYRCHRQEEKRLTASLLQKLKWCHTYINTYIQVYLSKNILSFSHSSSHPFSSKLWLFELPNPFCIFSFFVTKAELCIPPRLPKPPRPLTALVFGLKFVFSVIDLNPPKLLPEEPFPLQLRNEQWAHAITNKYNK